MAARTRFHLPVQWHGLSRALPWIVLVTALAGTCAVSSLPAVAWRLNAGSAPVIIIAGVITSIVLALLVRSTIDQKVLAGEIREKEARHLAVFEGSRDAIGVSKKGIHVYANPSYLRLFGYENNRSIVGTRIIDSIAPRSRARILENVERRAVGEQVPTFYEMGGLRTDGSEFEAEVNVSAYESGGEIIRSL